MDIIHLLPDSVANQIAAGEVIQRPASVVKELVENAVDAKAKHIDVIITDAGRTSIQVADDGCGMSETDARLAFERHATSKIRQADDLFTLTTLGFRGEALPSIASVAQVQLTTRRHDADLGTLLRIEASRVIDQQPEACPPGSNFVVRNLFFNVPARRKFLKTDQTEMANITTELERIVLVHHDTAFTLTHNGTPLLNLPPASPRQRVADVFGQRLADSLLPVDVETPLVSIHGFVGKPEAARKRGAQQFFFVDGRYMRHPYFHRAVQEAFAQLIAPDTSVPYFIAFDVNPAEIDVNIHPTKTEIKFENEQAIWQILLAALRESLGRHNAIPTIDFDTEGRPADIPVYNPADTSRHNRPMPPSIEIDTTYDPFAIATDNVPRASFDASDVAAMPPTPQLQLDTPHTNDLRPATTLQLLGRFIATTAPEGLMLVEQHRAHTRVLYNRYMAQMRDAYVPSQRLLFPDVIDLAPSDATLMPELMPELMRLGIDVSMLGPTVASIAGIPAGLEGIDPARLIADLIAAARQTDATHAGDTLRSRLALALARNAAIPVGQALSNIEMDDLLTQLFATEAPAITPDGKTIIATIPAADVERLF
ncbi:MAG: DNA mismatch repair endonuclease MutL [Bacteroidaceae bacterium]|nr:DNA mismatch repair endonuclease MutL [Bacteroidaceae bacterium]